MCNVFSNRAKRYRLTDAEFERDEKWASALSRLSQQRAKWIEEGSSAAVAARGR